MYGLHIAIDGVAQLSVQSQSLSRNVQGLMTVHQSDRFRKIADWLSAPDPWTNHASARLRHEPQTGAWLPGSDQYRRWKAGDISHLWVYGKAGCGKTVLCSTAIEDVRAHCENATNAGYAVFYFSFSEDRKQSDENFLRSLVVQLGCKEPSLSMLQQAFDRPQRSLLGPDDLGKILLSSFRSYDEVFLLLDALDECPEGGEVRQTVLKRLEWLSRSAPNVRILATSRELGDVRESMEMVGANPISIASRSVDADIRKYVSSELSRDRRLCRLDAATKTLIEETVLQKADGM